jgi:HEPN domain-containing protein
VDLRKFAEDYIARATERISAAEDALKRGSFPEVIRFSQEATELSLKAALRLVGIEYPKVHDVGDVLQLNAKRFPEKFQERIPQIAEFSREAAAKRSLAMYGVEASGKTPGQIFDDPVEAGDALGRAKEVLTLCSELLESTDGRVD